MPEDIQHGALWHWIDRNSRVGSFSVAIGMAVVTLLLYAGFFTGLDAIKNEPRVGAERAAKQEKRMDVFETALTAHTQGDDKTKAALADSTASTARAQIVTNAKLDALLTLAKQGKFRAATPSNQRLFNEGLISFGKKK